MKILFISAGNSSHTAKWVNALSKNGHEIHLIFNADHAPKTVEISPSVQIHALKHTGFKGYYLNARELKKIVEQLRPDVINVHYASGYGTLVRIAKLQHVLLSVWGSDVYQFPYESKLKKAILTKNLNYVDEIASTSYAMREQTKKFLKKKKEIEITPFGVDMNVFKHIPKIEKNSFTFGIVKLLTPIYGVDIVISAFELFCSKISEKEKKHVYLEIYGDGESKTQLETFARDTTVSKQIKFKGYIVNSKVPEALNKMDVCLLGSIQESFGVSVIEAMSCGIPVIATDTEGFKEVLPSGKAGYIVPVGDASSMAEKMLTLYRNPELRLEMGNNGIECVRKKYDWEKNVKRMEEIYNEMIKKGETYGENKK